MCRVIENFYLNLMLTIFIIIIAITAYFLLDKRSTINNSSSTKYSQYKPSDNDTIGYDKLRKLNSDVVGWITIKGTGIDYPILQSTDNMYYLHRDALKNSFSSGSIFLDSHNNRDFSDFNSIIYGHHMDGGVMFGDLDKFNKLSFFKKHSTGILYVGDKKYKIKFVAFLNKVDGSDYSYYNPGIITEHIKQEYIEKIYLSTGLFISDKVCISDKLIILSTCTNIMTNGRLLLIGKIV